LVQIHKKALADIALSAMGEIDGVTLVPKDALGRFLEFFGKKSYSGVIVSIDKDNQVSIKVRIYVKYGVNIPDIARQVQENIRSAVEKIADINLKDIHVNIQGIERGKQ
jgi:uncharacterized alkaline shock family protein YloU